MTKSRGIGRGGARSGAGRRPIASTPTGSLTARHQLPMGLLCATGGGVPSRAHEADRRPSPGPDVEKYSTPLMLRWIARSTSSWMRSGIAARSDVDSDPITFPASQSLGPRENFVHSAWPVQLIQYQSFAAPGAVRSSRARGVILTTRNERANRPRLNAPAHRIRRRPILNLYAQ